MLVRTTLLAGLAAAAALAAGGASSTVLVNAAGHDTGVTKSAPHTAVAATHRSTGAEHASDTESAHAADVTLPECPADVQNHGAYVSSVAKADHADAAPGEHGALVSAAARSDCGKTGGTEADGADADKADKADGAGDDADDAGTAGADHAAGHGKAGQPHGKSKTHPTRQDATARP
jgi:hypothetical protein